MLERVFKCPRTIQRLREGPFGAYIDAFVEDLLAKGYSEKHLKPRLGTISDFNTWLIQHQVPLSGLDEEQIDRFIRYRHQRRPKTFFRSGGHAALKQLIDLLRHHGLVPPPRPMRRYPEAIDVQVARFVTYLREEKGLSVSSVHTYRTWVARFLSETFDKRPVRMGDLCRDDVLRFLLRCSKQYRPKPTQTMTSALRSYLRFLQMSGHITRDLAGCIPPVPGWRATHLPAYLAPEEVAQLLKTCDRRSAQGVRNYAILLLLVRLGLRACEVMHLTLDDIDWEEAVLVIHGKGADKPSRLPLPHDVGQAVAAYLQKARPRCSSRRVFIRIRPPYEGLNHASSISTMVGRALLAAGLNPPVKGTHLLRYTAATECLRQGATLAEVGELLRHHSLDTTALYTKIDVLRLGELAPPWPDLRR